jgi:hypothetical protein
MAQEIAELPGGTLTFKSSAAMAHSKIAAR